MYRKEQKNGWNIEDKKVALIASLPPFLFGTAIWITWLVIGGPWYTATETQLKAGLASGLAVAAIIAIGGVWALIKRFSVWGYCWLGMDIVGFFLLAQGLVEETPIVLPGWAEALTAVVILGFSALVIIHAVLESWQAAGLVSIGLSTAMTLSSMYLIAVGPFHRVDLTILGPLCGLALSGLTYAYVRSSQLAQLGLISAIGLLNTVIVTIANQVWIAQMASTGKSAPLVSMLIFMLVMLLAGPVAGLFRKPMKTIIDRYFKN